MADIDINETSMLLQYKEKNGENRVVFNLLKDHTTQQNIYWATESYAHIGDGYGFYDAITIEKITGVNEGTIRPRSVKSKIEQVQRSKDKAEVFTPSWVCNAQNNLIDEAWFGRKNVFNEEIVVGDGQYSWITNNDKIEFPKEPNKTWKDYVAEPRLELTCGEAPYLVSRYDSVTGEKIDDVSNRIGLLDRKLRVVSENTDNTTDWLLWAKIALCSTYGFEWQGDNLFLAREALFYSFLEHYETRFGIDKANQYKRMFMPGVAYIISWNVWQMDGLTYGLPGYKVKEGAEYELMNIFEEQEPTAVSSYEQLCRVKDFFVAKDIHSPKLSKKTFKDQYAPTFTFKSLLKKYSKR